MKTKIIPFDLEMAKKIQAGEIEGKIKTRDGKQARILCTDLYDESYPMVVAIFEGNRELIFRYHLKGGIDKSYISECDLVLEIPDNEPQFKPFDKVLVRPVNTWKATFYSHLYSINGDYSLHVTTDGQCYANDQIIPYEGHEHLVGTTDKPKEE